MIVLLLIGGAFYGGLRASEWKGGQASNPAAPTDPLKAGRAAFDQGNYPAAAAQFTTAVERDAQNPEAHYWLGRAQMETGDYAKAAASFETSDSIRGLRFSDMLFLQRGSLFRQFIHAVISTALRFPCTTRK